MALVTGCSRNIVRLTAQALADRGADLVITYIRSNTALERIGGPADVSQVIAFLATDAAS